MVALLPSNSRTRFVSAATKDDPLAQQIQRDEAGSRTSLGKPKDKEATQDTAAPTVPIKCPSDGEFHAWQSVKKPNRLNRRPCRSASYLYKSVPGAKSVPCNEHHRNIERRWSHVHLNERITIAGEINLQAI